MRFLLLVIGITLLTACSDKPAETRAPEEKKKVATPWDPQIKALNDARGLENQMLKDAEEKDRKLREMGG
ncbi:hypothetical protein [Thiolapillus sp.]